MATTQIIPPEKSQALVKLQTSDLAATLAKEYGVEPGSLINTLIHTVFPHGANDPAPTIPQVLAFMTVCREYRLNPFLKQIYAFPDKRGGIVPMVPIDGWVSVVQSKKQHDGEELLENFADGKLHSVTCKIYRKDHGRPTVITEYMEECRRDTEPWKKWPIRMLRHKAYIQCARVAFGLSGIYDEDEAQRIIEAVPTDAKDATQLQGNVQAGNAYANRAEQLKADIAAKKATAEATAEAPESQAGTGDVAAQAATELNQATAESEKGCTTETFNGQLFARGVITKVFSPKPAGKGKKMGILIGEVNFSTWHESQFPYLEKAKGLAVTVTYSVNGQYNNIERLVKVGDREFDESGVPIVSSDEAADVAGVELEFKK